MSNTSPIPASSHLRTEIMAACQDSDWTTVERISLHYLCQNDDHDQPDALIARAALMAALRRTGQCYDYHRGLQPVVEDFMLYAALAEDGGEACACDLDWIIGLFLAQGHPIRMCIRQCVDDFTTVHDDTDPLAAP